MKCFRGNHLYDQKVLYHVRNWKSSDKGEKNRDRGETSHDRDWKSRDRGETSRDRNWKSHDRGSLIKTVTILHVFQRIYGHFTFPSLFRDS
jgi:hypothetical protein